MTIFYMCHLGTFSLGLHLELAPGHRHTAWEWIEALLVCLLKHLLSFYLSFLSRGQIKSLVSLFMCPSNPRTRYQRDLSLCNKQMHTETFAHCCFRGKGLFLSMMQSCLEAFLPKLHSPVAMQAKH